MISSIIGVLIFIVLASTLWWHFNDRKEKFERNISFYESMNLLGLPVVTLKCNNKNLSFVLDTGSNLCYIHKEALKDISYEYIEENTSVVTTSQVIQQTGTARLKLSYKKHEFDLDCTILDMTDTLDALKQRYGVTIHGLLGTDFFERYKYVLDFSSMVAYSLKK